MRILGVDPGERRVGLALTDEDGEMAFPFKTVQRRPGKEAEAAEAVAAEAREHGVTRIVMGLPLHLDGREGTASRRARRFGALVEERAGVPVVFYDERLTSAAAERSLRSLGVRGTRRRDVVDQSAAALLLQGYLDQGRGATWADDAEASRVDD